MKNRFIIVIILLSLNLYMYSEDNKNDIAKKSWLRTPDSAFWGNFSFKKGKYKKALEQYLASEIFFKKNDLSKLYYNIGNVYYKLNDNKKASQYYDDASVLALDDKLKSMIYYNYGLNEFKNQNFSQAADYFKKSLKYNPKDDDARYNYAVCNLLKKESEKNKDQNKNQNANKDKNTEKNEQKKEKQEQNTKLSKDDINKMLKALEEKERKENQDKNKNQNNNENNTGRTKYW